MCGFANGIAAVDETERKILAELFGDTPVIEVKKEFGEARAAASAEQAAHAAKLIAEGKYKCVLAVSFGVGGQYSAAVLCSC